MKIFFLVRIVFCSICIFCFLISSHSQVPLSKVDSLKALLKSDKEDSNKVNHLNELGRRLMTNKPDTSILLENQGLILAEKLNWEKGKARSLNSIGAAYYYKSDFSNSLAYLFRALKIDESLGTKKGMSSDLCNIGIAYNDLSDYPKALEYSLRALALSEEVGYQKGMASNLGNIGIVYQNQGNYPKALDYFFKAVKIFEEINNENGIATNLGNIGLTYTKQGDYAKAVDFYFQALKIVEGLDDKEAISRNVGNIGIAYAHQKNYVKALDYFFKAAEIAEGLGNKNEIAIALGNIGETYTKIGKFKEAETFLKRAIAVNDSIHALRDLMDAKKSLSQLYDTSGQYKLALKFYKEATELKDTIFTQEKSKDITRKEMSFEFEKKEAVATAEHEKQLAVAEAEKKKQNIIIGSVIGGLLLVACVLLIVVRSLRMTRKQKAVIELQKYEVEQQREIANSRRVIAEEQRQVIAQQKQQVDVHQKEIVDSITYAKRLQQAILPSNEEIKKHLPDSFLLYKPKDIVAGDFYWMEHLDGITFIAAADSTGHGVPGAIVSIVCSNALNRAVKEFGLRETGKILDKTRDLVLETFAKSNSDVKDGMDISLLAIHKKEQKVSWSGANNALWYIANGELKEVRADKQPIGKTDIATPFRTHDISYNSGNIFYLFTDGYADQFGGVDGKKFKYKQLEAKLLENCHQPMKAQSEILSRIFDDWKGGLEQVDDVTIVGIRL